MFATSSVTSYEVGLFLHITAVVVAFGVIFVFPLMHRLAERSDPRSLPYFYTVVTKAMQFVVTPAMAVLLVSGLYLIGDGPYGFGNPWVGSTFAILIALFAVIGAAIIPASKRLITQSEQETAAVGTDGDVALSKEYRKASRQLALLSAASALLALAAIFLMTTKP